MPPRAIPHGLSILLFVTACHSVPKVDGPGDEPIAGMGILVGEVTAGSALLQVRLTTTDRLVDGDVPGAPGVVEFTVRRAGETAGGASRSVEAVAGRDFIARASFRDLSPGTRYVCRTRVGRSDGTLRPGPEARFKTLPGPAASEPVRFVVVTGMNYAKFHGDDRIDRKQHVVENNTELPPPYSGPDKHLGYPALASILELEPDFFVGTGDNVYYDTPDNPRAKAIPELRQKWHEQFVQPRFVELFAEVPTFLHEHRKTAGSRDRTGTP